MLISIIICCYNSEKTIISVLEKLLEQDYFNKYEILIVNNLSTDNTEAIIQRFLKKNKLKVSIKILQESKPGLVNARVCGIINSFGSLIVFCDDDNLLSHDYLSKAFECFSELPSLGVLGPGIVEAIDINFKRLDYKWGQFFQEKYINGLNFCEGFGKPFLPAGTGIVIKRDVAIEYVSYINNGIFTATGRVSGKLLSGEDSQIGYTALKSNYLVAISDKLKLQHLTIPEKLTISYVRKMYFGCYSNHIIHCEAFPEFKDQILNERIDYIPVKVFKKIFQIGWRIYRIGKYKHFISFIADIKGKLDVRNEKSLFLEFLISILKYR